MPQSDFQINARVRSVLARHWIDTQKIRFGSIRGTVRMSGELRLLGNRGATRLQSRTLEQLESELDRIPGVVRVYYEFSNWRRDEGGQWQSDEKARTSVADAPEDKLIIEVTTRPEMNTKKDS